MTPPPNPLTIAIIGSGPAGLATAIALQRETPHVRVALYEQARELREVGAGISIGRNSWTVLGLLGVSGKLDSGHVMGRVCNFDGRSGEELHRREGKPADGNGSRNARPAIRTQRTKLQAALLSGVAPGTIHLGKKLVQMEDRGPGEGIFLRFEDGSSALVDVVVGADGIRSVVRDTAFPAYELSFTGTTIWRTLLPYAAVADLDPRFATTAWWHTPTTHVYFSPVGEGLWEIAARAWHDPKVHAKSKVSWGVPVDNAHVESHFTEYLPAIRTALSRVPPGAWREFAAFEGPELPRLTAWSHRVVLVGDASHALSGAFGSGAGFAMEDGWVLAKALAHFSSTDAQPDVQRAGALFEEIRLGYYSRMYAWLEGQKGRRKVAFEEKEKEWGERVRAKVVRGEGLEWIYGNDIGGVWRGAVGEEEGEMEGEMEGEEGGGTLE